MHAKYYRCVMYVRFAIYHGSHHRRRPIRSHRNQHSMSTYYRRYHSSNWIRHYNERQSPKMFMIRVLKRLSIRDRGMWICLYISIDCNSFEHSIHIINASRDLRIRRIELDIKQPKVIITLNIFCYICVIKVCGGPSLIELLDSSALNASLAPGERREIRFRIFGIDPMANADDTNALSSEQTKLDSNSTIDQYLERIPYTGVCLNDSIIIYSLFL